MKVTDGNIESGQEREAQERIDEAFTQLQNSPVAQAYRQLRVLTTKPELLSVLSEDEAKAIKIASDILEESPEARVLSLIARASGRERQWPEWGER